VARKAKIAKHRSKPKFKVRYQSRCRLCGRSRAVYQKFDLCRLCFRELALEGKLPGIKKASW